MSQIDTIVVKFASPCNIACTYCYEYAAGDETWRTKPKYLTNQVAEALACRIREYGIATGQSRINLVAHGGEPLMLGVKRLDQIFTRIRELADPVRVDFSVQTNGTLLTPEMCHLLGTHSVLVGVSLDGNFEHNSRRIDHQGRPTWDRVVRGLTTLRQTKGHRFGGILCVVDLEHEPEAVIDSLCALHPPTVDLLQPFTNHDTAGCDQSALAAKFGDWMKRAMRHWLSVPKYSGVRIRVFEDALRATLSRSPSTDWFGPRRIRYLVVETDGSYDLLDQLKSIGPESKLVRDVGRSIFDCDLAEAAEMAKHLLAARGGDVLPDGCKGCQWADVCAGGHLTARYSQTQGFNNRSVYCEGILALLNEASAAMTDYIYMQNLQPRGGTQGAIHV